MPRTGEGVDQRERLLRDDPDVTPLLAEEGVRVWVTDGMGSAWQLWGRMHVELAERLGLTQVCLSRLASVALRTDDVTVDVNERPVVS